MASNCNQFRNGLLTPTAMVLLPLVMHHAIERGFRCDVLTLNSQSGHDLAWSQALIRWLFTTSRICCRRASLTLWDGVDLVTCGL